MDVFFIARRYASAVLPLDRCLCLSLRVRVCHKLVLYWNGGNGWTNWAGFGHGNFLRPTLLHLTLLVRIFQYLPTLEHRRFKRPKIIINVNKRVYYERNNKRDQTLIINVDTFFQTVCKLCIGYFCSPCKFEIPVRSCSSQQNSFQNSYYKINLRESPSVNCFVNFYTSESVSLSFFYISCDVY